MKITKLPLVLLCAVMSTTLCAPRGDISEEEDGRVEAKPRYLNVESIPAVKKITDKVKDVVAFKKGLVHKLKKPIQIIENTKDKINEKKDRKWMKIEPDLPKPLYFQHELAYETVPCVYYPQFDLHYTPPLPYYYY